MAIKKILIVDDMPMYVEQIKRILTDKGYETLTACSGKEAVQKARSEKPDLIFMDVVMPEMDGFAACRELTKDVATKQIPVIFVSSKNTEADRVWAELQGAKAYITKPYTAEQILDQVEAFSG